MLHCQKSAQLYLAPVFSEMGMGILHSMNSTILQLNHLYVIRLSGGGAVWLPALKKIFLKPRVIFPFFFPFLQLSDLKEVVVETEAVKPSCVSGQPLSLLLSYILQAELRGLQRSCCIPPHPASRRRSLLRVSISHFDFCTLPVAPGSSPPI